jgi:hypothetical protein
MTAILGLFGAIAAVNPAAAATGQCFDAYGRPVGPPHNTDNPPYGLICSVYRQGGQCTHVQPQWAYSNCGIAPRHRYHGYYDRHPRHRSREHERHRSREYDQGQRHYNRGSPVTPWGYPAPQYEQQQRNTAR